jgi:hypothetical protein
MDCNLNSMYQLAFSFCKSHNIDLVFHILVWALFAQCYWFALYVTIQRPLRLSVLLMVSWHLSNLKVDHVGRNQTTLYTGWVYLCYYVAPKDAFDDLYYCYAFMSFLNNYITHIVI